MYSRDLFEGDIANEDLTAATVDLFVNGGWAADVEGSYSNAIRSRRQLWPDGRIPYTISSQYNSTSRSLIAASIQDYAAHTCIQWVPKTIQDSNYIHIVPERGCNSMVGMSGGRQMLSLAAPGCMQKGVIIHEMMHAVGFFHEQSRTDRDEFVTIMWNNIQPGFERNFEKYGQGKIQHLEEEYDYTSIMHYGSKAFSKNGRPTIVPKQLKIGQRNGFSAVDKRKINKLYGCSSGTGGQTKKPEVFITALPVTTVTKASTASPPPMPTPNNCKDHRGDCMHLAVTEWCQRNPGWMKQYCPVSCGMCPAKPTIPSPPPEPTVPTGECEDLRVDCEGLANQRYCTLTSNFMKTYCAKSCGFCSKPTLTELPNITPVRLHPGQLSSTTITLGNLVTQWRSSTTPKPTEEKPTVPPTPYPCHDKQHFCAPWKGAGFCEGTFQNYMNKNCPVSCGIC